MVFSINKYKPIVDGFDENRKKVEKLLHFDDDIVKMVLTGLRELKDRLCKCEYKIENELLLPTRQIQILEQLREHDSTSIYYKIMYNQSVVILVSYFGSAIHDILAQIVGERLYNPTDPNELDKWNKAKINIQMTDLARLVKGSELELGNYIISSTRINTQDMQSISRALETYGDIKMEQEEIVNNIIIGQASRHIIVHNGGKINDKFRKQICYAKPRKIKEGNLDSNGEISFTPKEVETLSDSMKRYIDKILDHMN